MRTWLVGGAVRDELLGLPVHERDWVVVGSTPQAMQVGGYRQVGRDFPVFLHPQTGEEYALARTERKTGPGYHGFAVHAAPDVSLAEDLRRRDLTINAIARAPDGTLFDPCGGQADLAARRLRHISPAFREDPLRILRVARFAARLAPLGFRVAAETRALMAEMVAGGELAWLSPERLWRETERALGEVRPECYFDELSACGALAVVLPPLGQLWGRPDSWARPALLEAPAPLGVAGTRDVGVRFAALCHEFDGTADLSTLALPRAVERLARTAGRHWSAFADLDPADGESAWALLQASDALRRPEDFERLLAVWAAAVRARQGSPGPRLAALSAGLKAASMLQGKEVVAEGFRGPAIGRELERRRREAVGHALSRTGGGALQGSE